MRNYNDEATQKEANGDRDAGSDKKPTSVFDTMMEDIAEAIQQTTDHVTVATRCFCPRANPSSYDTLPLHIFGGVSGSGAEEEAQFRRDVSEMCRRSVAYMNSSEELGKTECPFLRPGVIIEINRGEEGVMQVVAAIMQTLSADTLQRIEQNDALADIFMNIVKAKTPEARVKVIVCFIERNNECVATSAAEA